MYLEHPFYMNGNWIEAKDLKIGDELLSKDEQLSKITSITREKNSKIVYNFEVEDNHNYYISENAILVHNNCDFPMKPSDFGDKLDMQYFMKTKSKNYHIQT